MSDFLEKGYVQFFAKKAETKINDEAILILNEYIENKMRKIIEVFNQK